MKELLLLLCRYPFDDKNRETLSLMLGKVLDWKKFVELINAHGIIALANYNISEAGLGNEIPEYARVILENGHRQNVIRNIWLKERWKELDKILSEENISHVLLKGMALEHTIYDSLGLRQMSDIDILIRQDDSINAWQILQDHGFELKELKSPLFRKIMLRFGQHLPALFKDGCAVEIHSSLPFYNNESGLTENDIFSNLKEIRIDDRKALVLPEEVHLNYLIHHFLRHAGSGECQLRSYADLILMDNKTQIKYPDNYILKPFQGNAAYYRGKSFKSIIRSLPPEYRLRFILGDIFPSVKWMEERYNCTRLKAFLYYPHRIGKLFRLIRK